MSSTLLRAMREAGELADLVEAHPEQEPTLSLALHRAVHRHGLRGEDAARCYGWFTEAFQRGRQRRAHDIALTIANLD